LAMSTGQGSPYELVGMFPFAGTLLINVKYSDLATGMISV